MMGKKEVWKLTRPLKADRVFHTLAAVHTNDLLPTPSIRPEIEALPPKFIGLYSLDATSTSDNNPYYSAAFGLAQVLDIDCPPNHNNSELSIVYQHHALRLQATTRAKRTTCTSAAGMLVREDLPDWCLVAFATGSAGRSSHLHVLGEALST
jgi:hypothetical protein